MKRSANYLNVTVYTMKPQLSSHIITRRIPTFNSVHWTLNLLTWRAWWTPNIGRKWQMGFNSVFKRLYSA